MGAPEKTVAEILRELKDGQNWEENWQCLFHSYNGPIGRFFQKKGMSLKDSEDLTQEVFFYVYKSVGGIREEERFETWLFTIAKNILVNKRRETMAARRNPYQGISGDLPGSEEIPQAVSPGTDPEQAMLEKEKGERLRQALHELPGQMRRCVQLRVEDCPTQDIAAVLRISINTVKAHLHQAKRILRERLAPYFSDEVAQVDSEDR